MPGAAGLAWAVGVPPSVVPAAGVPAAGAPAAGVPAAGVPAAGVPAGGVPAGGVPAGAGPVGAVPVGGVVPAPCVVPELPAGPPVTVPPVALLALPADDIINNFNSRQT